SGTSTRSSPGSGSSSSGPPAAERGPQPARRSTAACPAARGSAPGRAGRSYHRRVTAPERRQLLYEGKAKRLYATAEPDRLLVEFKDDARAFNAQKRGVIAGKGAANNAITQRVFAALEAVGIPTHLVAGVSETEQLVEKVEIVPLEDVVRNRAAGSFAKRYGVEGGGVLDPLVVE